MSCGVGRRLGLDPALLWLWCKLAATGPIRPLAWEPPYAARVALEMAKRQKKTKQNKTKQKNPKPSKVLFTHGNGPKVLMVACRSMQPGTGHLFLPPRGCPFPLKSYGLPRCASNPLVAILELLHGVFPHRDPLPRASP